MLIVGNDLGVWVSTRGGRGAFGGPLLPPGEYRITVSAAGQQQTTLGRIRERIW